MSHRDVFHPFVSYGCVSLGDRSSAPLRSLVASNKNLSGLIIAQGVFGLSSHSAVCIALLFFFSLFFSFWQTGNSVCNFHENYDLLAFIQK